VLSYKYYLNIVIRIGIILVTAIILSLFIDNTERIFTSLGLFIILIIQIVNLLYYINKFNRQLAVFFSSLKSNDASFAFHDKSFLHISKEFRSDIEFLREKFFLLNKLHEIEKSYFKTVIENAQTGIITVTKSGKIDVINKSAKQLLHVKELINIKSIEKVHPNFYKIITGKLDGIEKSVTIDSINQKIPVSVRISEFKQKGESYRLIFFQNIKRELDAKETESWQKLIRVLTHEINNSVSPIISLSESLEKLLKNSIINNTTIEPHALSKTFESLQLISERGNGLIDFVNNYRSLSLLQKINPEKFKAAELFYNLELLMEKQIKLKNISLNIDIKPIDLELFADKKYIEQTCINLIKNSMDAVGISDGKIELKAYKENENPVLEITDNGVGIPEDLKSQVFIPFFTTKKQGSGIGLSLARQIMQMHGGSINIFSEEGKGTTLKLVFANEN